MILLIGDAVQQTTILIIALIVALVLTIRKKPSVALTKDLTTHIKGFAILGVLFAHIGYALVQDQRFLFPLSVAAGVCLNLFLFVSGYGLTQSMRQKELSIGTFYKRRLDKILIPFWMTLIPFFVADALILHIQYTWTEIAQSFLGFFPRADLYANVNSPLWYITFIIACYLIFPLVYTKRVPVVSSLLMALIGYIITFQLPLPVRQSVLSLYQTHILALPIGMLIADLFASDHHPWKSIIARLSHWFAQKNRRTLGIRLLICLILIVLFANIVISHAAIGQGWMEQWMSLLAMFLILGACMMSPFEYRFLHLIGLYSFEVYLIHWPILSRYDVLYARIPASIATIGYLILFLGLGYALQRSTHQIDRVLTKS